MRSEIEMMELILTVAREDERIRAVYLNGSRTNPNADKDIFQDYDVVYVVKETESFIKDESWIDIFGERLYMQKPEEMDLIVGWECNIEKSYGYLIQFKDGNRMDLHVQTEDLCIKEVKEDRLTKILMDKDNILPVIDEASDKDHWVKKPTGKLFFRCCNEFHWCLNNVAKGLWRQEVTYAMDMINYCVRPELLNMISWYAGMKNDFKISVGKSGKYLNKFITKEMWDKYLKTYSTVEINKVWDSVFIMCELFEEVSKEIAHEFGFEYNKEEAKNSLYYLKNVYNLPKNAKEVM